MALLDELQRLHDNATLARSNGRALEGKDGYMEAWHVWQAAECAFSEYVRRLEKMIRAC